MKTLEDYVTLIAEQVRKSDYNELRRTIHKLVTMGTVDKESAERILLSAEHVTLQRP